MKARIVLILLISAYFHSNCCDAQKNRDASWLRGKFGVMVHYLNSLQNAKEPWNAGKIIGWNECVNDFDVKKFVEQLVLIKADYVIFSVYQGDRYFCIPNKTFEKMTGFVRGTATSQRDLVSDLLTELNKQGIKLILYVTGDGVSRDYEAAKKLDNPMLRASQNNNAFIVDEKWVNTWSFILKDISLQYKNKIFGWWVDGTHALLGYNDYLLKKIRDALKAGNPQSLIAFNPSPSNKVAVYSKWDDFTAAEMYNVNDMIPPAGGKVNGRQWHILTFLGSDWARNDIRFSEAEFTQYLNKVTANNGALSLDVHVNRYGIIDQKQLLFLRKARKQGNHYSGKKP